MAYDIVGAYNTQKSAAEASAQRQLDMWNKQVATQKESAQRARDSLINASQGAYDNALKTYQADHDSSVGKVQDATGQAMQQAYISNQLSQRNIGQQLAAQGRSGGASESALLGIANTYGQTRGGLDTQRNTQLGDLTLTLGKQRGAALNTRDSANAQYASDYERAVSEYEKAHAAQQVQIEQTLAAAQQQIDMQIAQAMQAQAEAEARAQASRKSSGGGTKKKKASTKKTAQTGGSTADRFMQDVANYNQMSTFERFAQQAAQLKAQADAQKANPPYLLPGLGGSYFK